MKFIFMAPVFCISTQMVIYVRWISFLLALAVASMCFYALMQSNPEKERAACTKSLGKLAMSFLLYQQDSDEKIPPAKVGTRGWSDVLQPYFKEEFEFQCPSARNTKKGANDYFLNTRVEAMSVDKIRYPETTIICGDGEDDAPSWNSWATLPPDAVTNESSPSKRHLGAANYLCVDGHATRTKPVDVNVGLLIKDSRPSFAWR